MTHRLMMHQAPPHHPQFPSVSEELPLLVLVLIAVVVCSFVVVPCVVLLRVLLPLSPLSTLHWLETSAWLHPSGPDPRDEQLHMTPQRRNPTPHPPLL